jgi:hypothetical protein
MVWWSVMSTFLLRNSGLAVAAAAVSAAVAVGVPLAMAAPTAVPPSDTAGYLDSTARCGDPDSAIVFGSTKTARVAICKTAAGAYEYRGVRVSDGARLVAAAEQTSADTFVINNDGVTYTVTPTALSVTANGDTFRTETWTDYHSPQPLATAPSGKTSSAPSPSSSAPTPNTTASAAPTATSAAPKPSAVPSSAVPLPPPLAAEVGGGSSAG